MSLLRSARRSLGGAPGNAAVYRRQFVFTVHQVLAQGFARLRDEKLAGKEETAITGLVVEQMRALLASRSCPKGAEHFAVHDDRPESTDGIEGKQRARVDIVVERTGRGPRPQFHFEAKRLNRSDSTSEYVGADGMGCFLSGKYAKNEPDGGMLGYVQEDTPSSWASKLVAKLAKTGITWEPASLHVLIPYSYRSSHVRAGQPFELFHVLLACG